jgi:hypothetical protein
MVIAIASGWFSYSYDLHEGNECVAHIDEPWFSKSVEANILRQSYRFYRPGGPDLSYCLVESNGRILARADRGLFASFNLHIGETHYVWRPLADRFLLLQQDTKIGSVEWFGLLSRRAAIDLPEVIPLPAQVFLFWLAAVARRQSKGSGAD